MRPIFCGNFEYDARQSELERLFRKYGKVDRVDMKSGFAFIYMEDERDAEDAIHGLDRMEFGRKGRKLRVEWTKHERGVRRPSGSRRSSANMRPSKTLFVINFDSYQTRTRDLERHFEPYGKIISVRIRRNFAFVQYESEDDATKALEATNSSKLLDRVISVEYAARDDDERRGRYSPERPSDHSWERSRDRRRSPSPYRKERASPDYGHGTSPNRRARGSPDYGHGYNLDRRGRGSPDYGHTHRPSPYMRDRASPNYCRDHGASPHGRERAASDLGRGSINSPCQKEQGRTYHENDVSPSPNGREMASPDNSRGSSQGPYDKKGASPENGDGPRHLRDDESPDHGQGGSPNSMPDLRDSPNYGGPESPIDG